jgi:hypothetical protein
MEGSEYLYTVAEVSVAFAGFAAIALAIRHRNEPMDKLGRTLVTWLVERALTALGFSLAPILLHHFGFPIRQVLALCSALLSAYLLSVLIRLFLHFRDRRAKKAVSSSGTAMRLLMIGLMIPVQALAALGVLPGTAIGWYLLGVSWLLLISGTLFATILTSRSD